MLFQQLHLSCLLSLISSSVYAENIIQHTYQIIEIPLEAFVPDLTIENVNKIVCSALGGHGHFSVSYNSSSRICQTGTVLHLGDLNAPKDDYIKVMVDTHSLDTLDYSEFFIVLFS